MFCILTTIIGRIVGILLIAWDPVWQKKFIGENSPDVGEDQLAFIYYQ